jgi:hypothetical protein
VKGSVLVSGVSLWAALACTDSVNATDEAEVLTPVKSPLKRETAPQGESSPPPSFRAANRSCTGSGRIEQIADACIDDWGTSGPNDNLEIYCQAGTMRFCLSNEACPWRGGGSAASEATCSRAGLGVGPEMAILTPRYGCPPWHGHRLFCCYPDGDEHLGHLVAADGERCPGGKPVPLTIHLL